MTESTVDEFLARCAFEESAFQAVVYATLTSPGAPSAPSGLWHSEQSFQLMREFSTGDHLARFYRQDVVPLDPDTGEPSLEDPPWSNTVIRIAGRTG